MNFKELTTSLILVVVLQFANLSTIGKQTIRLGAILTPSSVTSTSVRSIMKKSDVCTITTSDYYNFLTKLLKVTPSGRFLTLK
jgi:hypothetical protein